VTPDAQRSPGLGATDAGDLAGGEIKAQHTTPGYKQQYVYRVSYMRPGWRANSAVHSKVYQREYAAVAMAERLAAAAPTDAGPMIVVAVERAPIGDWVEW
jgi:hypothetical protein